MQIKIFEHDPHFYLHRASRYRFKPEPLCRGHSDVFKFKFRFYVEQTRSQAFEKALRFGRPALYLHFVVSGLEGHNPDTVPSNRVPAFTVGLPHFELELGPAADGFALVVKVEGMIPDSKLVDFVLHLFIGLACVLPVD
jgi:hypothetical protein